MNLSSTPSLRLSARMFTILLFAALVGFGCEQKAETSKEEAAAAADEAKEGEAASTQGESETGAKDTDVPAETSGEGRANNEGAGGQASGDESFPPDDEGAVKLKAAKPRATKDVEGPIGVVDEGIALEVGADAPDFELPDADGAARTLSQIAKDKHVLLVFYRGGWCPYCNFQMAKYNEAANAFRDLGVEVVFLSVDQVDGAKATQAAYEVVYPVLSDTKLVAHKAYNVVQEVDEATFAKLSGYGIDVDAWSGTKNRAIAVPALFLVSPEMKVLWRHASTSYKVRPSVEQLMPALKGVVPPK